MGLWLLPRPPAVRSFHFAFPDDDDLERDHRAVPAAEAVEFRADACFGSSNDLYLCGSEGESPEYGSSAGKTCDLGRGAAGACAKSTGSGPGRCRGRSTGRALRRSSRSFSACAIISGSSGKARYIEHEDAARIPPLQVAINAFSGIPSLGRARPAEVASGRRQHLVPARHADGREDRERIPAHLPQDLRGSRPGLHGDERVRPTLCPRPARHHVQSRG